MREPDTESQRKPFFREMTVAHIREQPADYIEVVFLESARFYKLFKQNPSYDRIVSQLRDALAKRRVLKIRLASLDSDIIEEV